MLLLVLDGAYNPLDMMRIIYHQQDIHTSERCSVLYLTFQTMCMSFNRGVFQACHFRGFQAPTGASFEIVVLSIAVPLLEKGMKGTSCFSWDEMRRLPYPEP